MFFSPNILGIVYYLKVKSGPVLVERFRAHSFMGRHLAFVVNPRLDRNNFPGANTLAYFAATVKKNLTWTPARSYNFERNIFFRNFISKLFSAFH